MAELAEDVTRVLNPLDEDARATLFTEARTANTFAPTPVTDAELGEIWDLAKWAPTAGNMQPLRVLFVRTPEGRARLVEHMADGNKSKVESAPAVAVLAMDTRFHQYIPTLLPFRPELTEVYEADESMRTGTATFNSTLQAGYFILAVRALGLAAGPMAGFDAAGIDGEFFPDGQWKSILVVNIGHPGENPWFERLPRLNSAETLRWV
jgi:3-hydroxypropanoate dehydrogenase